MAASIPNPSLVFVPLDILTADELNKICRNVTYLADLFPITAQNMNWRSVLDRIYPVGSIFTSVSHSTSAGVASALGGGTWVPWGSGRVPVGVNTSDSNFNSVEKTGGASTHTLTTDQMPSHTHLSAHINMDTHGGGASAYSFYTLLSRGVNDVTGYNNHTAAAGSGQAHNNLQPYITVYMWKRTA